jgi:hypothetical protein
MDHSIEASLDGIAKSQEQLARLLAAKSDLVLHMARMVTEVPLQDETVMGSEAAYTEAAQGISKQLSAYLHTLGDLEAALADNVKAAIEELRRDEGE